MKRLHKTWAWMKKNWVKAAWIGFVVTRFLIFIFPPAYVRYFETYANIWHYGLPPYLKHWYEYPPASIPFVMAPLLLDLSGVGKYRFNFRAMILIVDVIIFWLIMKMMAKQKLKNPIRLLCIGFYLGLTLKGKDFMYENLDSLFALSMLLPALAPLLMPRFKDVTQWLSYWFGVGLKLVNLPLGWLYFWHLWVTSQSLKEWVKKWWIPIVTFLVIWLVPLAVYRSSLSVILVYHQQRGLQAEAVPSLIVRGLNIFTQTEEIFFSEAKSYDLRGPLSEKMLPISLGVMAVAMVVWVGYVFVNRSQAGQTFFLMKATLLFVLSYIVTNKVFSTPYHWWYLALITIYPYRSNKERLFFFGASAVFLGIAMSRIPILVIGPTDLATVLPVVFQIPASIALLVGAYRLQIPEEKKVLLKDKAA